MKHGTWKKVAAIGSVSVMLLASGCMGNRDQWPSSDRNAKRMVGHISRQLELTDRQTEQLRQLLEYLTEKLDGVGAESRLRTVFYEQVSAERFDASKLKAEIGETIESLERAFFYAADEFGAFHSTLTSEQRVQLAELMRNREHRTWRR